jgi:hypothetical protein
LKRAPRTNYFNASGTAIRNTFPGGTIGTAIPEPSAFGYGALALVLAGAGRWARRTFFAA